MTTFSKAPRYAKHGWKVFPLVPGGKEPLISKDEGGRGAWDATDKEPQIQVWLDQWPDANIGMTLGGLLVVDIDPRNGGDEHWTRLCLQHGEPKTLTQQTGSGGLHYVFQRPDFDPRGKPLPGIDCKHGPGQYIVVAPSRHPCGGLYRWLEIVEPQPLPEWLADLLRRPEPAAFPQQHFEQRRDKSRAFQSAAKYLDRCPIAISGAGGHQTTFTTTLKLVGNFPELDESDLWILLSDWNQRCDPPWSKRELMHKLSDALRAARRSAA